MTRDQLIQLLGLEDGVIAHVDKDSLKRHPIFGLAGANADALRGDLRIDTKAHLRTLTNVKADSSKELDELGSLVGQASVMSSSLGQVMKFVACPDGSWAINFDLAGKTSRDLAAALDMAAAQFAAMDAHAISEKWIER